MSESVCRYESCERPEHTCPWCEFVELTKERDALRAALEEICQPSRLADLSKLASNPPKNGAVYDIQSIARKALGKQG